MKLIAKSVREKLFFVHHIPNIFHFRLDPFVAGDESGDFVFGMHNGGMISAAHNGSDGRERKREKFGYKIDTDHTRLDDVFVAFFSENFFAGKSRVEFESRVDDVVGRNRFVFGFRSIVFERFGGEFDGNRLVVEF